MNNLKNIENRKIIVITGASRGIGKECALNLANENSVLVLLARKEQELQGVAQECMNLGAIVEVLKVDLINLPELKTQIANTVQKYTKIDILINNAGIWDEQPFEEGDSIPTTYYIQSFDLKDLDETKHKM